jgi:hypothetical protein
MPNSRKDSNGHHGYTAAVAWIVLLLFCYWLISEWNALPALLASTLATVR